MNAEPNTWTIAYRKPRANRFQRVTNWFGTWNDAYRLSQAFAKANPELQVFYVPTLENEVNGPSEDAGNILVDSGKRVRIIDNGLLTGAVLDYAVSLLWEAASEDDATIDEAYAGTAEDAGISVPRYLACKKMHVKAGEIFISGLWNTPLPEMTKVVVFEEGARHGVSAGDAAYFTGEVYDMPKGEVYKCLVCRETFLVPDVMGATTIDVAPEEIVSPEFDGLSALKDTIRTMRPLADKAEALWRASLSGSAVEEINYQVWQDFKNAIEEMTRTLWIFDEQPFDHACRFEREVGVSGCAHGCKIYRCEGCGTDKIIHNATYGCRNKA